MAERPIFMREQMEGLYHSSAYLLHKLLEEVAVLVILSPVVAAAVHYATSLSGSLPFLMLSFLTCSLIPTVIGYFFAASMPTAEVAASVTTAWLGSLMYFTGFFIPWREIPPWWGWYADINYLRYSSGALLIDVMRGSDQVLGLAGVEQLQAYDLMAASRWAYLGFSCCFLVAFIACTWMSLRFINHIQR